MLIGNFADAAQAYTRASKDSWADERDSLPHSRRPRVDVSR